MRYRSVKMIQDWLSKQPPAVAKRMQSETPIEMRKFNVYVFMVENKVKPPLEPNAAYKHAGGQTIAYHEKNVNVVVCPIVAVARDRFLAVLDKKVKIMTGMSIEAFETQLNNEHDVDDLWKNSVRIDNDFSKYDKCNITSTCTSTWAYPRTFWKYGIIAIKNPC